MSVEDLEAFEADLELQLYREYRDVISLFSYAVETERRFYLANSVDVQQHSDGRDVFFEVTLTDAWVWDTWRTARFVTNVRILTYKDVNIEELAKTDFPGPEDLDG